MMTKYPDFVYKRLFWAAAVSGFIGFGLALGIYWGIRFDASRTLVPLIEFFIPVMLLGLTGSVISNFIYFSKKEALSSREQKTALILAGLSLIMIFAI